MTGPSMKCTVEGSFDKVFRKLSRNFGNVYSKKFDDAEQSQIGILLGEQYFLRTNSGVAISIILKESSSNETEIEVFSFAGEISLLSWDYGAHSDFVSDVKDFLVKSGFKIKAVKEPPSIDRLKIRGYY